MEISKRFKKELKMKNTQNQAELLDGEIYEIGEKQIIQTKLNSNINTKLKLQILSFEMYFKCAINSLYCLYNLIAYETSYNSF